MPPPPPAAVGGGRAGASAAAAVDDAADSIAEATPGAGGTPPDSGDSGRQRKPEQGRRKGNPDHPRGGGGGGRGIPRSTAYASGALQDAGRLALAGFPNDPRGYDAVLARVRAARGLLAREFGRLGGEELGEQEEDERPEAAGGGCAAVVGRASRGRQRAVSAHAARCALLHAHGHNPFACAGCWLLPGRCVCAEARADLVLPHWSDPSNDEERVEADARTPARPPPLPVPVPLPPAVARVVVHAHHSEWRRASGTGCLAPLVLRGRRAAETDDEAGGDDGGGKETDQGGAEPPPPSPPSSPSSPPHVQCLMAGHAPHDAIVAAMVADPRWLPVLLFPRRAPGRGGGAGRRPRGEAAAAAATRAQAGAGDDGSGAEEDAAGEDGEEERGAEQDPQLDPAPSVTLDEAVALAIQMQQRQQQEEAPHHHPRKDDIDDDDDDPPAAARRSPPPPPLPLLLVVPDGTWQQARRLSLSYGPGGRYHDPRLRFLELPKEAVAAVAARGRPPASAAGSAAPAATTAAAPVTAAAAARTVSLLAPARLYRGAATNPQRVSTAEALAAALEGLESSRARAGGGGATADAGGAEEGARAAAAAVAAVVRGVQLKVRAVRRQGGKGDL